MLLNSKYASIQHTPCRRNGWSSNVGIGRLLGDTLHWLARNGRQKRTLRISTYIAYLYTLPAYQAFHSFISARLSLLPPTMSRTLSVISDLTPVPSSAVLCCLSAARCLMFPRTLAQKTALHSSCVFHHVQHVQHVQYSDEVFERSPLSFASVARLQYSLAGQS